MLQNQKQQLLSNLTAAVLLVQNITPEQPKTPTEYYSRIPRNLGIGDWRLTRNKTKIIFGCGEVRVNKSDLLLVAEYNELKAKMDKIQKRKDVAMNRLVIAWKKHNPTISEANINKLPVNALRAIAG